MTTTKTTKKLIPLFTGIILFLLIITAMTLHIFSYLNRPRPLNIGIVPAMGGLGDRGFNDEAFAGVISAQLTYAFNFDVADIKTEEDVLSSLTEMSESRDYDLIIAFSSLPETVEALNIMSLNYPLQHYSHIDSTLDLPNVSGVQSRFEEQAFLTGVIAGLGTIHPELPLSNPNYNAIGIILGQQTDVLDHARVGYTAGAKYVNPDVTVITTVLDSFLDIEGSIVAAHKMYEMDGVDFIQSFAGGLGQHIHGVARTLGRYSFGSGINSNHIQPNHVVATASRDVGALVYNEISQLINDTWSPGLHLLGLREGAVGLERDFSNVVLPDDIETALVLITGRLLKGELSVPKTDEALSAWLQTNQFTQPDL